MKQTRPPHVCTSAVLQGLSIPPAGWQILSDIGRLPEADLPEPPASVWLHFDRDTVLAEREQQIARLRTHLGAGVPILLVERGVRLRHIQSMRLMNRGVTLILPDIGIHDLLRIATSWQKIEIRQVAEPLMDPSGESAPSVMGYLPPARFHRLLARLLEQDSADGVQSALLRFRPLPGFSLADVAQAYTPNREHDVFTLDEQHLYLFLHGCMDADIDIALDNLFSLPPGQLFDWEQRFVTPSDILAQLAQIRHKAAVRLPEKPDHEAHASSSDQSARALPARPAPLNWPSGT